MRLLFVARSGIYPLTWGDRLLLYHVTRGLAARGHVIDLLAFEGTATRAEALRGADHLRRAQIIPDPVVPRSRYLARALGLGARFPAGPADAWSPAMWRQIRTWIADGGYDLVHVFGGVRVYEYARAFAGLPAVIQPYDSYSLIVARRLAQARRPIDAVELWVSRRFERFMYTPYRRTIFVAQADADYVRALRPDLPVAVIANGVDTAHFDPAAVGPVERDPHRLVFVGYFSYAPNIDAAIQLARVVLPKVRAVIPQAHVVLVGSDPAPEVRALAGDGVTVTGQVDDIRPYVRGAAAFVCPMRQGAGIKNKLLEALALASPVIATPLSLAGIDVEDGVQARIASVERLAQAVIDVLRDPAGAARLGEAGRARIVERYSWAHSVDQYASLYEQVLREAQP
ncbi:MAG: glycosyltransferase family 4 protein [Anaerolinea sp.]|nr:glycosyltransferase family 4 protein [Anaerolinea sp.]